MKRSEVIKLMMDEFITEYGNNKHTLRLENVLINCLKALETNGMLPPRLSDGQVNDFGDEISGPEYGWEPEDEKK